LRVAVKKSSERSFCIERTCDFFNAASNVLKDRSDGALPYCGNHDRGIPDGQASMILPKVKRSLSNSQFQLLCENT
jgi:hypothetical protein